MLAKRKIGENLKEIFLESDTDRSGVVNMSEFKVLMRDERFLAYLRALGISMKSIPELFDQIDADGSGTINADEFVNSLLAQVGGQDKNVQIQMIINWQNAHETKMQKHAEVVELRFRELRYLISHLGTCDGHIWNSKMQGSSQVLPVVEQPPQLPPPNTSKTMLGGL